MSEIAPQPCIFRGDSSFCLFSFLVSTQCKNKSLKAINLNSWSFQQLLLFWYLFIRTFLWQIWIIWYFERQISQYTYRYAYNMWFLQVNLITEGGGWRWIMVLDMCIVLISLHWQPMWIIIHVIRELQLPASTKGFMWGGGGTCTSCIEGFMESFYLFSYCILTVTRIKKKKKLFKALFFLPPPQIVCEVQSSINGIFILIFFFFPALTTTLKLCIFL